MSLEFAPTGRPVFMTTGSRPAKQEEAASGQASPTPAELSSLRLPDADHRTLSRPHPPEDIPLTDQQPSLRKSPKRQEEYHRQYLLQPARQRRHGYGEDETTF